MALKTTEIKEEKKTLRIGYPVRQRLFSLKEAAQYLGRGEDSLREMVYAGEFPVIQAGERSKMWLDLKDLDQWIEKMKHYLIVKQ